MKDGKVRIYDLSDALTEKKVLVHAGTITALKFSPDGKYLVVTDVARKVILTFCFVYITELNSFKLESYKTTKVQVELAGKLELVRVVVFLIREKSYFKLIFNSLVIQV